MQIKRPKTSGGWRTNMELTRYSTGSNFSQSGLQNQDFTSLASNQTNRYRKSIFTKSEAVSVPGTTTVGKKIGVGAERPESAASSEINAFLKGSHNAFMLGGSKPNN